MQKKYINQYILLVFKECVKEGIRTGDEVQRKYFDNFNRDVGKKIKASITRDKTKLYTFIIEINGIPPYTRSLYQENNDKK
jgi:hypothetical protein